MTADDGRTPPATTTTGAYAAATRLGPVTLLTYRGPAGSVLRHVPSADDDVFWALGTQARGSADLVRGARRAPCAPGQVFLMRLSEPWELHARETYRLHLYRIPRRAVGASEAELLAARGVHGQPGDPVTRLLAPVLLRAADSAAGHPEPYRRDVAAVVTDLLGTLAAARAAGPPEPAPGADGDGRETLRRIRHFVNEHLGDRDLSPERIAARHHVSVRYLHKVFAAEGTTLARWIKQRRLEECRRELGRRGPADPVPSVAAVARRWGFVNAAHFSRSFRAAYGMSPGEWHRLRTASGEDGGRGREAPAHASVPRATSAPG
ncbi:helix-turn-helix domain-containing protein [Streptomyces tricolor]|uniref:helix-turn-helix domain-containing protein n=1 Tax=Streptomyces tricolor TaxID=68277 RepID=UPI0036E4BFE2